MRAVLFCVLFGITAASYQDPLKDLRNVLRSNGIRTKQGWDLNSLLRKRNLPSPPPPVVEYPESAPDQCYIIYTCPGFTPCEPSGSPETGYTLSINMFQELCNFSRAFVRCYDENPFYQSCSQVTEMIPRFRMLPRLCERPALDALEELLPCLNQKTYQDEVEATFENLISNTSREDRMSCEFRAEIARGMFMTVGSQCSALQFGAALNLNAHIPMSSIMTFASGDLNC